MSCFISVREWGEREGGREGGRSGWVGEVKGRERWNGMEGEET